MYGKFDRPEQRKGGGAGYTDVNSLVSALYSQWYALAYNIPSETENASEQLHNEAQLLIEPHKELLSTLKDGDLEKMLARFKPTARHAYDVERKNAYYATGKLVGLEYDLSGVFVTALFNNSGQNTLSANFYNNGIGHRLAQGKRLVVRKDSKVEDIGILAKGEIFNSAKCDDIASQCDGALVVNFGELIRMGNLASSGTFVNFGNIANLGSFAIDGNYFNFGRSGNIGYGASNGLFVNVGETNASALESRGGVHLHLGTAMMPLDFGKMGGLHLIASDNETFGDARSEYDSRYGGFAIIFEKTAQIYGQLPNSADWRGNYIDYPALVWSELTTAPQTVRHTKALTILAGVRKTVDKFDALRKAEDTDSRLKIVVGTDWNRIRQEIESQGAKLEKVWKAK